MDRPNNFVKIINNKYIFFTVNVILFLAAILSLFMFGTVRRSLPLLALTIPDTADMVIVSVYIIIAAFLVIGTALTVTALVSKKEERAILCMCGGTLLFTAVHIVSAHILSLASLLAVGKGLLYTTFFGKTAILNTELFFPFFEVIFMTLGSLFVILFIVKTVTEQR